MRIAGSFIEVLKKRLGHDPTPDEVCRHANGAGLLPDPPEYREAIEKASADIRKSIEQYKKENLNERA